MNLLPCPSPVVYFRTDLHNTTTTTKLPNFNPIGRKNLKRRRNEPTYVQSNGPVLGGHDDLITGEDSRVESLIGIKGK